MPSHSVIRWVVSVVEALVLVLRPGEILNVFSNKRQT